MRNSNSSKAGGDSTGSGSKGSKKGSPVKLVKLNVETSRQASVGGSPLSSPEKTSSLVSSPDSRASPALQLSPLSPSAFSASSPEHSPIFFNRREKKKMEMEPNFDFSFQVEASKVNSEDASQSTKVAWKIKNKIGLDELLYPSLLFKSYNGEEDANSCEATDTLGKGFTSSSSSASSSSSSSSLTSLDTETSSSTFATPTLIKPELRWTCQISSLPLSSNTGNVAYDDIKEKGEVYLREELKRRAKATIEENREERRKKIEEEKIASGIYRLNKTKRTGILSLALPGKKNESTDELYLQLVTAKQTKMTTESSSGDAFSNTEGSTRQLSAEETYHEQRQLLKTIAPRPGEAFEDGLLFYRLQAVEHNEFEEADENSEGEDEVSLHSGSIHSQQHHKHHVSEEELQAEKLANSVMASPLNLQRAYRALSMQLLGVGVQDLLKEPTSSLKKEWDFEDEAVVSNSNSTGEAAGEEGVSKVKSGQKREGNRGEKNETALKMEEAVAMFGADKKLSSANKVKRNALDILTYSQLKQGLLTETFFKKYNDVNDDVAINLSNRGIGDEQGVALGLSFFGFSTLGKLVLKGNRFSSCIPTMMRNLSTASSLRHLDLSTNALHANRGIHAIANFLREPSVGLLHLNISNSGVTGPDVQKLCRALADRPISSSSTNLQEFIASSNCINADGAKALADMLLDRQRCTLRLINLGWNECGTDGATSFAEALRINTTLTSLDLSSNGVSDKGGQRLAAILPNNSTLEVLSLAQNRINGCCCFVFSRTLKAHPSMRILDLSNNALGEPGARSIFRTILRGLKCFVVMRNCSFPVENLFDHSQPGIDSPYSFDMSEPYSQSVVSELITIASEDPVNCRFGVVTYAQTTSLSLVVVGGEVMLKGESKPWAPPTTGTLVVNFYYNVKIPSVELCAKDSALKILALIVIGGRSEVDRQNWIRLLCFDLYCTTTQAQTMIDTLIAKQVIGIGGLTMADVMAALWSRIVDSENMYDFFCANMKEITKRNTFVYAMRFEVFKFNWANPTGHWRFDLSDRMQRIIMLKLMAINEVESDFSKRKSGRGDTSQEGNWFNFRNCYYSLSEEADKDSFIIDRAFLDKLPTEGVLEFDYVSTRRPMQDAVFREQDPRIDSAGSAGGKHAGSREETVVEEEDEEMNEEQMESRSGGEDESRPDSSASSASSASAASNLGEEGSSLRKKANGTGKALVSDKESMVLSPEAMLAFLKDLGLSARERCVPPDSIFALLYLTHASCKYYFTCSSVASVLETFSRETSIQARVVVSLFSRIWDLHNFDVVMRALESDAQIEVVSRLGFLNVVNPLKPSGDYSIYLKYLDNRMMLVYLLEIGPVEFSNQIEEDRKTELSVVTMYGSLHRVVRTPGEQTMLFNYAECGQRTSFIAWNLRRDALSRFLVGTQPIEPSIFKIINWHIKMVNANEISRGPIELQWNAYLKRLNIEKANEKAKSERIARKTLVALAPAGGGDATLVRPPSQQNNSRPSSSLSSTSDQAETQQQQQQQQN